MVKTYIVLAVLSAMTATAADYLLVWDSRFASNHPPTSLRCVDAGVTNRYLNPDYLTEFRGAPLPALWNPDTRELTPWTGTETGTVEAADGARANKRPAYKALRQMIGARPTADAIDAKRAALRAAIISTTNRQAVVDLDTFNAAVLRARDE